MGSSHRWLRYHSCQRRPWKPGHLISMIPRDGRKTSGPTRKQKAECRSQKHQPFSPFFSWIPLCSGSLSIFLPCSSSPAPYPPLPPFPPTRYFRKHHKGLSTFLSKALIWLQHRHSNLCRMWGEVAYSDAFHVELDISVQTGSSGMCRAGQSPWQGLPLLIYMLKVISAAGTLGKNEGLSG